MFVFVDLCKICIIQNVVPVAQIKAVKSIKSKEPGEGNKLLVTTVIEAHFVSKLEELY
jgi:hypothetical protein